MEQTNRKFASENAEFKTAADSAEKLLKLKTGSLANHRQASKFRRKFGIAYKMVKGGVK